MARFVLAGLLLLSAAAQAQRMYVTDELVITLRTGPSTQNTVIANLQTGDELEVLEVDEDAGYTRVRVSGDGDEGWVLTRYLMSEPSSDQQLATAQQELSRARELVADLQADIDQLTSNLSDTSSALSVAEDSHRTVSAELDHIREASANVIELENRNESLRRSNIELSAEVDALTVETSRLGSRNRQNWFVVGALVLMFGFVVGLVAPSLRSRKRTDW